MDRLLARLERRFGRFAIEHLMTVIVVGMGFVFIASMAQPRLIGALTLDLDRVRHGEIWRLFTYLLIPQTSSPFFIIFALLFFYSVGNTLESEWGAFRFNVYYLIGMIGTTVAAAIAGGAAGSFFLNLSLVLAWATLFPNAPTGFFFIPMPAKWLGLLDAAFIGYQFVVGGVETRAAIVASLANYILFFTGHWIDVWRGRNVRVRQAARRASSMPPPAVAVGGRVCAICGAAEDDGADIRVCSCGKCGGPRNLCLEHARNH